MGSCGSTALSKNMCLVNDKGLNPFDTVNDTTLLSQMESQANILLEPASQMAIEDKQKIRNHNKTPLITSQS